MEKNDIIYMFSDGYADQFGGSEGKKFKYRRLRHLLLNIHHNDFDTQLEILENTFQHWKNDNEQVDDILFIGIKPLGK